MGRISQRLSSGAKKQGGKKTFNESAASLASGSVSHLDLRLAEANLGWRGLKRAFAFRSVQATELMLVTIAVLRCS